MGEKRGRSFGNQIGGHLVFLRACPNGVVGPAVLPTELICACGRSSVASLRDRVLRSKSLPLWSLENRWRSASPLALIRLSLEKDFMSVKTTVSIANYLSSALDSELSTWLVAIALRLDRFKDWNCGRIALTDKLCRSVITEFPLYRPKLC
jgi:hypothetical protein